MKSLIASLRLAIITMLMTVGAYTGVMLALAGLVAPDTSQGSLMTDKDGTVVGSRLVAQKFTKPAYFWPRPSAVDYNASGAGGSNKSPTSADLTDRATKTVADYGASSANLLPVELAAASGGGLDPHITERGSRYQAERVAMARGVPVSHVEVLIQQHAVATGGFLTQDRLVNVLELNLALDANE